MARPQWKTQAGDLGTIAEREYFELALFAQDTDSGKLTFSIIGGSLPRGLKLVTPVAPQSVIQQVLIYGTPLDVATTVASKFVIRATSTTGSVSDRTFTLSVAGQDAPQIAANLTNLGDTVDGAKYEFTVTAVDLDSTDTLTWSISRGTLPLGLTLDSTNGKISGYAYLENTVFGVRPDKTYNFTVSVTDGKDYSMCDYQLRVVYQTLKRPPIVLTPPSNLGTFLHDNYVAIKFDGVDLDGDLFKYAMYNSVGFDTDIFAVGEFDRDDNVPIGLEINPDTGWMYGFLPKQTATESEYSFGVQVYKAADTSSRSEIHDFTMTVDGETNRAVTWTKSGALGVIPYGGISELYVAATNTLGHELFYRLADNYTTGAPIITQFYHTSTGVSSIPLQPIIVSGALVSSFGVTYLTAGRSRTVAVDDVTLRPGIDYTFSDGVVEYLNFTVAPPTGATIQLSVDSGFVSSPKTVNYGAGKLPQGLKLLPSGLISGRTSFMGFTLDKGACTFDKTTAVTQFDSVFRFTVEAYDVQEQIKATTDCSIRVDLTNAVPYDNLYGVGLIPQVRRAELAAVANYMATHNMSDIYRYGDEYFGIQSELRLLIAAGLTASDAAAYQLSVLHNHYTKRMQFGGLSTARSLNIDGTVQYEVVYANVVDTLINNAGISVSRTMITQNHILRPNSIVNMRNEVIDRVGQVTSTALPGWMTSKQENGKALGQINAVVLCYAKPGKGKGIAFNLARSSLIHLEQFDMTLDRYVWDNNLSKYYTAQGSEFTPSSETTLDKFYNLQTTHVLAATVDFAVDTAYSDIEGKSAIELANRKVFDMVGTDFIGKTMIFATQEDFATIAAPLTGWEHYVDPFDDVLFDSEELDSMYLIPSYSSGDDERGGVYHITQTEAGDVRLILEQVILPGQRVDVRRGGILHGGASMFYDNTPRVGTPEPTYGDIVTTSLQMQTTFDRNGTRFFNNKDVFAAPGEGDQYIKFPQVNILR